MNYQEENRGGDQYAKVSPAPACLENKQADPPAEWGVARLSTPAGSVYLATDDDVASDLRAFPDPDGNPRVILTRDEIDGLLSVVCRIAPPDHLKLTLWRELRALVALKRALPGCGPAEFVDRASERPPCALAAQPAAPPPLSPPETQREQLSLLP